LVGTVPVTAAPPRGGPSAFREDIQGLRGVAVLLVVLYHADGRLSGGFIGVDVFFTLSGFLVGGLLLTEARQTGRIDLLQFVTRRARRLLPALAVLTTVTVFAAFAIMDPGSLVSVTASTGIGVSLLTANAYLYRSDDYFAPAAESNPLLHTWSLSLEEQIYLLLPVMVAACVLLPRYARDPASASRRLLWVVLVGATVVSGWLSWQLVDHQSFTAGISSPERFAFYAPVTRLWEFTAGTLLALVLIETERRPPQRVADALGLAGLLALAGAAVSYNHETAFPGLAAAVPVVATLLLLVAGTRRGRVQGGLSNPGLVRLGDLSYSWYLWHWPSIVLSRALWPSSRLAVAGAALMSLAPAWASYRLLEQRFRRDQSLRGRRALVLVIVAVSVPVAASMAVLGLNEAGRAEPDYDVALLSGCSFEEHRDDAWPAETCTWGSGTSDGPRILLAGDSHASALSNAAVAATERVGGELAVWARQSTPLVGRGTTDPGDPIAAWFELIDGLEPDLVIVANRSPIYLERAFSDRWQADRAAASTDRSAEQWGRAVGEVVDAISARGSKVVWTAVVPEYPTATSLQEGRLRREPRPTTVTHTAVEEVRGEVVAAEVAALETHPAVWLFDPTPHLCGEEACSNVVAGEALYRDEHHLSARGSAELAEPLLQVIAAALGEHVEASDRVVDTVAAPGRPPALTRDLFRTSPAQHPSAPNGPSGDH
jgi:peptidoglycan/LPS O-acetylase OafA/YrhL